MGLIGRMKTIRLQNINLPSLKVVSQNMRYHTLYWLLRLISFFPLGFLYVVSDMIYFSVYYVMRYRRKIVRKNLRESFPEKSMEEIIGIEKRFYHFFVDMVFESCKLISITPKEIDKRLKVVDVDFVNRMLGEGRSVSLFLGHYGNWEWVSLLGLKLHKDAVKSQIYHKLRDKAMDRLMREIRGRFGNVSVEMRETVRFVANAEKEERPYIIGYIADQSPRRRVAKHFVNFLNHSVPVLTGSEKVTKHYGYEAVFLALTRLKRGYYECRLSSLHDNPKSLPDFELTRLYFERLESEIKERPEFYLWTHNRFKYAEKSDN